MMRNGSRALVALTMLFTSAAFGAVDVNRADAETLARALPGIGPAKAAAIVRYRSEHGPFRRPEDLLGVRGIGPRLLERVREHLRFPSDAGETAAR